MSDQTQQIGLDQEQISRFYHDLFVKSQVEHFSKICAPALAGDAVVSDMGGGCGFFASAVARDLGFRVRVVDADPISVDTAAKSGVEAVMGNALSWSPLGDESVACFNLILHHLVGAGEQETTRLQMSALAQWKNANVRLFVNEYIYDSYFGEWSGMLIYKITKSRVLSFIAGGVARFIPSLQANTFGVGVRFRSENEWRRLFDQHGWHVVGYRRGGEEGVSLARRALLIKSCRRDSFVLTCQQSGC